MIDQDRIVSLLKERDRICVGIDDPIHKVQKLMQDQEGAALLSELQQLCSGYINNILKAYGPVVHEKLYAETVSIVFFKKDDDSKMPQLKRRGLFFWFCLYEDAGQKFGSFLHKVVRLSVFDFYRSKEYLEGKEVVSGHMDGEEGELHHSMPRIKMEVERAKARAALRDMGGILEKIISSGPSTSIEIFVKRIGGKGLKELSEEYGMSMNTVARREDYAREVILQRLKSEGINSVADLIGR